MSGRIIRPQQLFSSAPHWSSERDAHHVAPNHGKGNSHGRNSNDVIVGTDDPDDLYGGKGNDTIYGRGGDDDLDGGAGNDRLYGGDGNDSLDGGSGNDTLSGGAGDDWLYGGAGNDAMAGGDGSDHLHAGNGNDLVEGGEGDDWLLGEAGNDDLFGGGGNDTLTGGAGHDFIDGGAAENTLEYTFEGGSRGVYVNLQTRVARDTFGDVDRFSNIMGVRGTSKADTLIGVDGPNASFLVGLAGNDTLISGADSPWTYAVFAEDAGHGGTNGVYVNLAEGYAIDGFRDRDRLIDIHSVIGTNQADTVIGSAGDDGIQTLAGDDYIDGGDGWDTVGYDADIGWGAGLDHYVVVDLAAGTADGLWSGHDVLQNVESIGGTQGNDFLYGDDNDNGFGGNEGDDWIEGRGGNDFISGQAGNDTLYGGDGNDWISGGPGINSLYGQAGDDTLIGGDDFDYIVGGQGNDMLDGGGEQNVLSYENEGGGGGVIVNFEEGWATDTFGDADTFVNFTTALGSDQNDVIVGSTDGTFHMFVGMAGSDTFVAGSNSEFVSYATEAREGGTANGVAVNLAEGWATDTFGQTDTLTNVRALHGTNFVDNVTGSTQDDFFQLFAGNDVVNGNGGWDTMDYSADIFWGATTANSVSVDLEAGTAVGSFSGTDQLVNIDAVGGTQGDDTLRGDENDNWLGGNDGVDWIEGRGGNDYLVGGEGDDLFVFGSGFGVDTIEDFVAGAGTEDVIRFDSSDFADFDAVMAKSTDEGDGVRITVDDDNSVFLVGVQLGQLSEADFQFI